MNKRLVYSLICFGLAVMWAFQDSAASAAYLAALFVITATDDRK